MCSYRIPNPGNLTVKTNHYTLDSGDSRDKTHSQRQSSHFSEFCDANSVNDSQGQFIIILLTQASEVSEVILSKNANDDFPTVIFIK